MKVLCLEDQRKRPSKVPTTVTIEKEFRKEARFLKQMQHPHIVRLHLARTDEEAPERKRNRSGESSKSNNSSGSGSSSDE